MNEPMEQKESFIKEIVKFTILALVIVVPIRLFIAQPFIVSGASMDPTFETGQYLIVDQLSYHISEPKRGEVVIFKYPLNTTQYFIKRIIGLPGETVSMNDGILTITNADNPSGFVLEEPYITEDHRTNNTFRTILGDNEYFVMGDNRPQSSDSRIWGPLDRKYIVGTPFVRLLPLDVVGMFPGSI